jgi:opacity protein-like surface antigen
MEQDGRKSENAERETCKQISGGQSNTQLEGGNAMIRLRMLVSGLLATVLLLASSARAQEGVLRHEVGVQGTGFFTQDSQQNGTLQHSTNTGGFLVNYRFHLNGWLAAEASYGYDRNTQQNFTPGGNFGIQSNVHQASGALVVNIPVYVAKMRPYVLGGAGALVFDPTANKAGFVSGAQRQARPAFVYGGGVDYRLVRHVALRMEYRGFVYNRPDFGLARLSSNVTTHAAQPSAGLVFHF